MRKWNDIKLNHLINYLIKLINRIKIIRYCFIKRFQLIMYISITRINPQIFRKYDNNNDYTKVICIKSKEYSRRTLIIIS